jgi:hypothetical protein
MDSKLTDDDVIVANETSKSALRVPAKIFSESFDDVDYYTSYEMVRNSTRDVWYSDMIHIKEVYVRQLVDGFLKAYFSETLPMTA